MHGYKIPLKSTAESLQTVATCRLQQDLWSFSIISCHQETMVMISTTLTLYTMSVILLTSLCTARALVIYVDHENGTEDHRCWTGGISLPCKDYELAKEGALYLNISKQNIVQLTSSSNQSCQQNLQDAIQNIVCVPHEYYRDKTFCDNNRVSIRTCDCMTYNNDKCSVLIGDCPYGCGFTTDNASWSWQIYHQMPKKVSEYNLEMCGRLNRDGPMCSKCRKGFSPLVYSYELKCVACKDSKYNWLKFAAVAFIPLTFFYLVVVCSESMPLVHIFMVLSL